jgi:hypothetical protein
MPFTENAALRAVTDTLLYSLIVSYLIYILIEGWHRLHGIILN